MRALALIEVLLFHSRFRWARGGFLGVTTFFVLSGFLITGLLLLERHDRGRIDLAAFWARRARRLAPAVLVLIALVALYVKYATATPPHGVVGDGFASAMWIANWRFVFARRSYAALFGAASPFEHMWSLAVEEQVYLALPLAAVALLGWRRRRKPRRWLLASGLAVFAASSTVAAAMLHHPNHVAVHEYYGTDARAAEPLVGALLAIGLFAPGGLRRLRPYGRYLLDAAALIAGAGLVLMVARTGQQSDSLYRGGFLKAALLSAIVVAAASQRGVVARLLGLGPLAALGRVSYGAYLFHWPLFLWLTPRRTGLTTWPLFGVRVGATLALAVVSYGLIEQPIRVGDVLRRGVALLAWGAGTTASLGVLAAVSLTVGRLQQLETAAVPAAPAARPARAQTPGPSTPAVTAPAVAASSAAASVRLVPPPAALASPHRSSARPGASPETLYTEQPTQPSLPPPPANKPNALRVAVIGDSMGHNLGSGLEAWSNGRDDVAVYNLGIAACPLSRGGTRQLADGTPWEVRAVCGWWANPSSDWYKAFVQFNPDVVVAQDGANEIPDRKVPGWSSYRHAGDPQFDSWLVSEYQSFSRAASLNGHASVMVLNAVCADWEMMGGPFAGYAANGEGNRRATSLDTVTDALAASGTQVVDYESYLCPNGQFTETVAGVPDGRPDGYHLSYDAAGAVAEQWLGPMIMSKRRMTNGPTPTIPGR